MTLRLGDILVHRGILTADQRDRVLAEQASTGRPFGAICEQVLGIDPQVIEHAWAEQYATMTAQIDPRHEVFEPGALELVSRRQAWQFRVLPIRFDGNELMLATTQQHLCRALRFAARFIGTPVYFVMADARALGEAMCRHYPFAGMTADSIAEPAFLQPAPQSKSA